MKRLESLFLERHYDGDKGDFSSAGRMILSRLQGKKPHIQFWLRRCNNDMIILFPPISMAKYPAS